MEEPKKPQEEYAFLQERIKPSKLTTRRVLGYIASIGVLGIIFGICASLAFVVMKPNFESLTAEQESVQIPEDVMVEMTPDIEEIVPPIEQDDVELDLADVEAMNLLLTDIAKEIHPSLFSVYCKEEGSIRQTTIDPSNAQWAAGETTGVLVAKTSNEYLILTPIQALTSDHIYVESYNGYEYSAVLKQKDENLGYAILSVRCVNVTEEELVVATLSNSNLVKQGEVVLVVGNHFGYGKGIAYGIISSAGHSINLVDGEYKLLSTDIPSVVNGTGVMIDTEGEVIGLVNEKVLRELGNAPISALGISGLKATIERLSNGEPVPYMGITGLAITEALADEYNVPVGYYVQKVATDSPAMLAGIKSGDIIITVDGTAIYSSQVYRANLLGQEAGQEVRVIVQRMGQGEYVDVECNVVVESKSK